MTHTNTIAQLKASILRLEAENNQLRDENAKLKAKTTFFEDVDWLESGLKGEKIIAEMLGGELTNPNARHDVTLPNKITIEVKFSNLSYPFKNKAKTLTWKWAHLMGLDGLKKYDHLILVGEIDENYKHLYADPNSPYIFFDIPFEDVLTLPDKSRVITLTTNPKTVRSKTNTRLYRDYQITKEQLREKYIHTNIKCNQDVV